MSKDITEPGPHPLLISGDVFAGGLFVRVLEDVVEPVIVKVKIGRARTPLKKGVLLENRGFDAKTRKQIAAGSKAVAEEAIRQLLFDFYVAYPKRVREGALEYKQLRSIVDGTWSDDSMLCGNDQSESPKESDVVTPRVHHFFTEGDPDLGRWFVRVVEYYRSERKRVRDHHNIGALRLERISTGDASIPLEVFADIVTRVYLRVNKNPMNVAPRAFKKLEKFALEQEILKGGQ